MTDQLFNVVMVTFTGMSFILTAITLLVYVSVDVDNLLTPERAFVSLALFQLLQQPLAMLVIAITLLIGVSDLHHPGLSAVLILANAWKLDPS